MNPEQRKKIEKAEANMSWFKDLWEMQVRSHNELLKIIDLKAAEKFAKLDDTLQDIKKILEQRT